jgi:hypothetical protein
LERESAIMTEPALRQPSPVITSSYTLVRPKVFGAVSLPIFQNGGSRSIPAQVGIPICWPAVRPVVGTEHPHESSISTDEGKPVRAVKNDPTAER